MKSINKYRIDGVVRFNTLLFKPKQRNNKIHVDKLRKRLSDRKYTPKGEVVTILVNNK